MMQSLCCTKISNFQWKHTTLTPPRFFHTHTHTHTHLYNTCWILSLTIGNLSISVSWNWYTASHQCCIFVQSSVSYVLVLTFWAIIEAPRKGVKKSVSLFKLKRFRIFLMNHKFRPLTVPFMQIYCKPTSWQHKASEPSLLSWSSILLLTHGTCYSIFAMGISCKFVGLSLRDLGFWVHFHVRVQSFSFGKEWLKQAYFKLHDLRWCVCLFVFLRKGFCNLYLLSWKSIWWFFADLVPILMLCYLK